MVFDDNDDTKIEQPEETVGDVPEDEDEHNVAEDVADWAALAEAGPAEVKRGDIVSGVVVGISTEGVSVDLGAKLEGLIGRSEFASEEDMPKVDERIDVAVLRIDDENGVIRLSKRRADFERVWVDLEKAAEAGELVDAMVTDRVKGGLRVDVGVPGFIPASQVGTRDVRNLERFVGRSLRLKVLEVDRRAKKVVLSHRQVVEEERAQKREETMAKLEEGAVLEGKVRNLTSYGAFIDLGGVDGLLHVSEMAWTRIKDPSAVLKVGDTINVVVLEINPETEKISLSLRQILPDPWKETARKLRPGQMVKGTVTRVVRTGAFANLEGLDIEGFIPASEMSQRRGIDPKDVVQPGQVVDLKINDIRVEARRMTLSLTAAEQQRERQEYQSYMSQQKEAKVTLGDRFGALFQQLDIPAEGKGREEVETDKDEAAQVQQLADLPDQGTAGEQQNLEATASELAMSDVAEQADENQAQLDSVPSESDTEAEALDNVQPEAAEEEQA
ncbi:MAG: 30S ribosomal protein S1 [Armatimonadia bacterium]